MVNINVTRLQRKALPYIFVLPVVLLLLLVNFYPMLYSFRLSLSVWPPEKLLSDPEFAGLVNIQRMFTDARLWNSAKFTFLYTVIAISLEFILGIIVAVNLDSSIKARGFVRSVVIMPIAMAPLVAAVMWGYMLNGEYGLINYLLSVVGIKPVPWLSANPWALISVVIVDLWQHTPFVAIVLLAGLQAIPDHYAEAAHVDGASKWQVFWSITLPLLRPALLVAGVIRTTNAVRMFDLSYALTAGGPFQSTETFSYLAYEYAFRTFEVPYAAAISWLVFLLNLIISVGIVRVLYAKIEV